MTILYATLFLSLFIAMVAFTAVIIQRGVRHRSAVNYIRKSNPTLFAEDYQPVLTAR